MHKIVFHLSEGLPQLIHACCKGDRAAQAGLYRLHCNKMMGVCMWYAKNREEAEEILQDGFVQVFLNISRFTGEGSLEGWIRKIMVNAALQKYRSKKTSRLYPVVEFDSQKHDPADDASFIAGIDEKELVKQIQSLPPVYRMVFNLYVFEGLKHKEIAAQLGISEGTSKSNLSDARTILRKKMNYHQNIVNG